MVHPIFTYHSFAVQATQNYSSLTYAGDYFRVCACAKLWRNLAHVIIADEHTQTHIDESRVRTQLSYELSYDVT